ncbi:MAG: hypothetical protein ACTSO7_18755 [Candidatus Heimdallarchaeota archaeon]
MSRFKRLPLFFLIITTIILFQSFFVTKISASTFPFQEYDDEGTVRRVINDKLDTDIYLKPEINIVRLTNNEAESQIKLKLYDHVNISSRYEYRILIGWNEILYDTCLWNWPDLEWYNVIPPKSNYTICIAGGSSWSGLTNGSYSAYYNSNEELVFSESNNGSVSIYENNTLIFPITETYLENPNYYTDALVFTSYNATINSSISDFYIDTMPYNLIINMFTMYTAFTGNPILTTLISVLFSGIVITFNVKKKKEKYNSSREG